VPRPKSRTPFSLNMLWFPPVFAFGTLVSTIGTLLLLPSTAGADTLPQTPIVGVGSQYDSTHVYVAPDDIDRFVTSFVATFGGTGTARPSPRLHRRQARPSGKRHLRRWA
jgi:hypothetical protein